MSETGWASWLADQYEQESPAERSVRLARQQAEQQDRADQLAEAGDRAAGRRLERLGRSGVRAGQCMIDLAMGWHRHAGRQDTCEDPSCPEASDGAAWAASWEGYWPPGQPPGK